jgi:hypothetical protein
MVRTTGLVWKRYRSEAEHHGDGDHDWRCFITQAPTLVRRGASHAVIPVTHHFAVTENANQAVSRVLTASEKGHAPNQGSVGLYQRLMKVANFVRGYRDSAGVKTAACTGLDDDCAASGDTGALAPVRSSRSRPLRFAT